MTSGGAGYSGTPLPKKLGIKPGHRLLVLGDPLTFDPVTLDVSVARSPDGGSYDVVLLFCPGAAHLFELFETARGAHTTAGSLWVCWPKRSSGIVTDLTETTVREFALANGRVDTKVAAIDPTWSGLKFVIRLADR